METTVYTPIWRDSVNQKQGVRYACFTNRRTWPIDFGTYSADSTTERIDEKTLYDEDGHCASFGLGNIDVRRPVVVLKNSTSVMADRFRIVNVSDTTHSWEANVGETVALDWLKPGWGAFYKIIPIPTGVALLGTSYNNAVHATNPSTATTPRDQIYVYERDSTIFMRTLSPGGTWSREWTI